MSQTFLHIPLFVGIITGVVIFENDPILGFVVGIIAGVGLTAAWIYSAFPNRNYGRDRGEYWGWNPPGKTPLEEVATQPRKCSEYVEIGRGAA